MNDLFISEKNISLQKKSTTQVNAQCTLEIQLVQCLNLMTLIVVRLLRQPGRNAFTTSESIYDLYSKHENYKDSTSKSKEIHFLPISEKNVSIK